MIWLLLTSKKKYKNANNIWIKMDDDDDKVLFCYTTPRKEKKYSIKKENAIVKKREKARKLIKKIIN